MTHQDIVDELMAVSQARLKAYNAMQATFGAKVKDVQAECAKVGHIWANKTFDIEAASYALRGRRTCVVCGAMEPE